MSRDTIENLSQDGLAFEYVSGLLRGKEREDFEVLLQKNVAMQHQVQYWEEQLMSMSDTENTLTPHANTWSQIERRIAQLSTSTTPPSAMGWKKWLQWLAPSLVTAIIVSCVFIIMPPQSAQPNADYIAVLTSTEGKPILSALTASTTNVMWLKWEKRTLSADKNLQLWAISKRDGQARSISIFSSAESGQIRLSKANLHLVKEAADLILTEEDVGGSVLDEPSNMVIAKGACVLITPEQAPI